MIPPEALLAKSPRGKPFVTLLAHTDQVVEAAGWLFVDGDGPSRLGRNWLRFFRLTADDWPRFRSALIASAALHDLGKANDGFQRAVRREGEQVIRHEHLSGLIIALPDVWAWLGQDANLPRKVILSAVVTHHQKAIGHRFADPIAVPRPVQVLTGSEFRLLTDRIGKHLRITAPFPEVLRLWTYDGRPRVAVPISETKRRVTDLLDDLLRTIDRDRGQGRLLRAVRTALIAADAVASGLIREGHDIERWIGERTVGLEALTAEKIQNSVITPRINEIEQTRECRFEWSEFQNQAAELPTRALLLAPCGAGKTLAAWRWIEARLRERPARAVVFLYPTRATATEGFRDYVSWAPEAAMLHGTAEYELDDLFANPPLPDDERKDRDYSADPRLFALGHWHKQIFSATVDQFLAFLANVYGPTCLLPVLADAVVVIDEVHSFDDRMFSALKQFLIEFDVPALCLTATLLKDRRGSLERECGLRVYDDKPDELADSAKAPRYHIRRIESDAAITVATKQAEAGRRVLWVVNRVARAQELASRLMTHLPTHDGRMVPVLCYHSRFTLDDRKRRHDAVVKSFKPGGGPVVAVTTQVCEMSLDLDADVLITEDAPLTALVQRMGRCNRKPGVPTSLGEVFLCRPPDRFPYEEEDIAPTAAFVEALTDLDTVSQQDLEDLLGKHSPRLKDDPLIKFISEPVWADGREESFRDGDERSVQAVLDVAAYIKTDPRQQPGLIVPTPWKLKPTQHERLPRHLWVAPSGHYDRALGLREHPVDLEAV